MAMCKLKHLNIDYLSLCVAMLSFGVPITLNTIIFSLSGLSVASGGA